MRQPLKIEAGSLRELGSLREPGSRIEPGSLSEPGDRREPGGLSVEVERLVRRYAGRLGPAEAQDLAQQAALRALERGAPDGRTGPWLQRIAANLVIDGWRQRQRAGRAFARAVETPAASPEDALLAAEARRAVRHELAALGVELRRPVLLRYYLDASYDRAAGRLRTIPPTARSRVRRALGQLRARLAALRAWMPAWPLSAALQPALVALCVLAAEGPFGPRVIAGDEAGGGGAAHAGPPRAATPPALRQIPPARAETPETVKAAAQRPEAPAPSGAAASGSSAGRAPQSTGAAPRGAEPEAPPPLIQKLSFEDDDVTGELQRPDGDHVTGEAKVPFGSLIEIRPHFQPEIVKTLEDM